METPAHAQTTPGLSKCPFCGSKAVSFSDGQSWQGQVCGFETFVFCHACGARGPWGWYNPDHYTEAGRKADAAQRWNRRIVSRRP
jgi:Lar family restriction alleviation protein